MFYRSSALCAAIAFSLPFNAHAIDCEKLSPLKVALGDKYYELDNNREGLKVADKHSVTQALNTIENTRYDDGQATRQYCKKVDGELTVVTDTLELKDSVAQLAPNGNMLVKTWAYNKESRITKKYVIAVPLSVTIQPGSSSNQLILNQRFRKANTGTAGTAGTHMMEYDISLTVLDNSIEVVQDVYINGHFSELATWTFNKK